MNFTNATELPLPVGNDGWAAFWQYIAYVIEGIIIGGSNLFIVIVILRFHALRNAKEFVVIGGLALADAFYLIGYLLAVVLQISSSGVRRIRLVLTSSHSGFITPWECATAPQTIIWLFSEHLSALMLLIVSCDRLLPVLIPMTYFGFGSTYALTIVGGAFAFTLFTASMLAYQTYNGVQDRLVPVACFISSTMKVAKLLDVYVNYYKYVTLVFTIGSVLLYGVVWTIYKKKSAQVMTTMSTQQNAMVTK